MCTIVFAWRNLPEQWGVSTMLVANRDESYARPSDTPRCLVSSPTIWGGRDRLAGGTWLAIDEAGRIAAVTNRHPNGQVPPRDPKRQSRGRIPLDLLQSPEPDAVGLLQAMTAREFNPVNVLYLGLEEAWVLSIDDVGKTMSAIAPGVHVLGESDLDDASEKTSAIHREASEALARADDRADLETAWVATMSSHQLHGEGQHTAACIHGNAFGTVSSAVLAVRAPGISYRHAEGPPCITPFECYL